VNPPLERSTTADADRHQLAWAAWPADLATPVRLFLALRAARRQVCLLESVEGPARLARYSFLGVDPVEHFRGARGLSSLRGTGSAAATRELRGPVHEALRSVSPRNVPEPPRHLPPFVGGWIGWFSYEWAASLEPSVPLAAHDPWEVPEATFDRYVHVIGLDHAAQKIYFVARCEAGASGHAAAQERLDAIAHDALRAQDVASGELRLAGEFQACLEPERYREGVAALRAGIAAGEIFQAVLAQRFEQRFRGDPFTLYRVLRLVNPSPHMFYFQSGGLTLAGSSPERLVSVQAGLAENRPIAGTRPRGATPEEDERLARELKADPKERAEHDMLVDLARNDLGRVARIGTVHVREHAALEKFARVQHLVSRVECQLAAGRDALDALAASFPAGTVSGAPKVRAMQLIAGLEPDTRGPYAGCFGYLDFRGNLDMALVLRSFVARGETLSLQAGAGVVFDSDPERERLETLHKAQALFEAARLADSETFRAPRPNALGALKGGRGCS
jgi:anthranilate synthase component 1